MKKEKCIYVTLHFTMSLRERERACVLCVGLGASEMERPGHITALSDWLQLSGNVTGAGFNWNLGIASVQSRTQHNKAPYLCEH